MSRATKIRKLVESAQPVNEVTANSFGVPSNEKDALEAAKRAFKEMITICNSGIKSKDADSLIRNINSLRRNYNELEKLGSAVAKSSGRQSGSGIFA
jgi:hypothetical protein